MAKRERATRPKQQAPRTQAALDAGRANLAKGRESKEAAAAEAKARGAKRAGERWAMLLDGRLTIKELDDEEIKKGRVRGADGGFTGRRAAVPSHLMQQFQGEAIRRAKEKIVQATPEVTKILLDMLRDEDVPVAQRVKIGMYLMDRQLGKAPETIRVEGASEFDKVTMEALGLDREMVDMLGDDKQKDDGPRSR